MSNSEDVFTFSKLSPKQISQIIDAILLFLIKIVYKNAAMGINTDPCIKYAIKAKSNLIHFVLMDNANKHKAMATPFRITLFV